MVSETSIHTSPSDRLTDRFDQAFQSLAVLALGQTVEDMTGHVREIITTIDLKHMSYARFVTKKERRYYSIGCIGHVSNGLAASILRAPLS